MSRSSTVAIRSTAPAGVAWRTSSRNGSERASRSRTMPDEVAQVGLDLALGGRREAQLGDGLDVESLVGLEQLERLQAQAGPVVGRPGTALAHDPAERRHPAEALVRLEHPVALDAAIDLGPRAELVEQVHLVPARDPAGRHARRRAAHRRDAAARTAARPRGAPRGCDRPARRGTTPSRRSRGRRGGCSQAWPDAGPRSRRRTSGRGRARRSAPRRAPGCRRAATSAGGSPWRWP